MKIAWVVVATAVAGLGGCCTPRNPGPDASTPSPTHTSLRLIESCDALTGTALEACTKRNQDPAFSLTGFAPAAGELDVAREGEIASECGIARVPPPARLAPVVIAWLAGATAKFFVEKVDESLANEIKSYTSNYRASAEGPFYRAAEGATWPRQGWVCFRFSRYRDGDSGKSRTPELDLIGEVRVDRNGLKLRPLRLYYAQGAYPKATNRDVVGIVVTFQLDGAWRQGNRMERATVVDAVLLKEKRDLGGASRRTRYYFKPGKLEDWSAAAYQLPVPYSVDTRGNPVEAGWAKASVTVDEAGQVPAWLQTARDLFARNKDKIRGQLATAIESAME